jgi:hypothetical protein
MSILDKSSILTVRATSIKHLMERAERKGSDCHEMDNIRHCAAGVLELIECDPSECSALEGMIGNLERRSVELFKKRFAHLERV